MLLRPSAFMYTQHEEIGDRETIRDVITLQQISGDNSLDYDLEFNFFQSTSVS